MLAPLVGLFAARIGAFQLVEMLIEWRFVPFANLAFVLRCAVLADPKEPVSQARFWGSSPRGIEARKGALGAKVDFLFEVGDIDAANASFREGSANEGAVISRDFSQRWLLASPVVDLPGAEPRPPL